MVFIDYHLSTSSKKSVVIPFRFRSNDEPIYILTSTNGWNAVQMTKVDTIDSDKHVHLYKHTVILPSDVSNIQYKFRIGENLYLHDDTEDTTPDGFGGFNNTFEVLWDPICSTSTHEPSTVIETPSDAGSLQVSEEESDPVGNSQMPSNGLPAANDQKLHAFTGSALHTSQTLFPELVSTTPGAVNGAEPKESGHTPLEKDAICRRTLSEHLYGPITESEEQQDWANIYRNNDNEIVVGSQQDSSALGTNIQNRSQSDTIPSLSQKTPRPQKAFDAFKLLFGFTAVAIAFLALWLGIMWWHTM